MNENEDRVQFKNKDTAPIKVGATNCFQCGRFCRTSSPSYEYDGNGTQCYVTFYCSLCGTYTEGLW